MPLSTYHSLDRPNAHASLLGTASLLWQANKLLERRARAHNCEQVCLVVSHAFDESVEHPHRHNPSSLPNPFDTDNLGLSPISLSWCVRRTDKVLKYPARTQTSSLC